MLSVSQKELYELIVQNKYPIIEKKDNYYIINNNKVARITDYLLGRFDCLEERKKETGNNEIFKKMGTLVDAHFQLNKIQGENLKEFISKIDEDDEIEIIKSNIYKTYKEF